MSANMASDAHNVVDAVIIGAGISGMTLAIDMIRLGNGRNFVILEKGRRVGGTWSDNEYPGCCCDVWSHLYSLSFCPNPNWSREYPTQPEIQRYLADVARKYDLERNIRFDTEVEGSSFDPTSGIWTTTAQCGKNGKPETFRSRFVVSAIGQLNQPKYPNILGLDGFAGKVMHSARWDKSVDLRGKRIAVIGNGASAIQIVPELAKVGSEVVVFQRSPNWVTPRNDATISTWRQAAYRYLPFVRSQYRAALMDVREAYWKVLVDIDSEAHQTVKSVSADLLAAQLPGDDRAELRRVLTPNYPPGCKRILISDDYYPALGQANVTLETAAIVSVTAKGIRLSAGWNSTEGQHEAHEHDFDTIVCATGFQATSFLSPMKIEVAGQAPLVRHWAGGAYAYKGISVPDLPNFAIMYGPNTNLGHNSIILMIEAQSAYINRLLKAVCANSADSPGEYLRISPRESANKAWNTKLQAGLASSTLASNQCSSWYKSDDGLITTNWSGTAVEYQHHVSTLDWNDYELQGRGAAELRAQGQISWPRVKEETQPKTPSLIGASSLGLVLSVLAAATLISGWPARFAPLRG